MWHDQWQCFSSISQTVFAQTGKTASEAVKSKGSVPLGCNAGLGNQFLTFQRTTVTSEHQEPITKQSVISPRRMESSTTPMRNLKIRTVKSPRNVKK